VKATAGSSMPVRQDASCQSSPCDLSQLPVWVMLGGYAGSKPRVLHRSGVDGLGLPHAKCGWSPSWGDIVPARLMNPALVRPCKRCFPDYRQPLPVESPTVGVRATVTIDTSRRQDLEKRPVAVFGIRYHFMEPLNGNDDAFVPICGTGGLLAGKGRLRPESEATANGFSLCRGCSEATP